MAGRGRPTQFEVRRRIREFWRSLAAHGSFEQAAADAGLSAERVLTLLDDREASMVALRVAEQARAS